MGKKYNNNNNTKKSGATLHTRYGSSDGLFMTCWRSTGGKMWKGKIFRSAEQSKIAPTVSRSGKEWVSVTCVFDTPFTRSLVINALMNVENHKVYIKEWNYVINPKAPNGGYCGQHISK